MPSAIGRLSAPEKSRHRDEAVTASFSLVTRETPFTAPPQRD
jgi:hypothetical protein